MYCHNNSPLEICFQIKMVVWLAVQIFHFDRYLLDERLCPPYKKCYFSCVKTFFSSGT